MTTKFEDIVNVPSIGKVENPINMNNLLKMAGEEKIKPANQDAENVLLLGIDFQKDFLEGGALGVSGANGDVERVTRWIYSNMKKITEIAVSIDTHIPQQIFHPCWWIDSNGNHPDPFTAITLADLDAGKWNVCIAPIESREYVMNLEKNAQLVLVIWPYHCLKGTVGAALDSQFANMVLFHSVARMSIGTKLVKGENPYSEMYGIIKPEYDKKNYINLAFLNKIEQYSKVVIAGEAASHCVLRSIQQILEHFANKPEVTKNIYILEDCMSFIPGFENTKQTYVDLQKKYGINLVNSTNFNL